ncbi:MAG TPA: DUF2381 family protein [Archangium sp.]|nr:DUF2381 family protein [Archangium sp.]
MLTSPPAVLLLLALLADASATAQPPLPSCEASPHRIELLAAPTDKAPEVCISPDLPTTFRFDSPLPPGAVELQERERFEDVSTGTRSITVIPPKDLRSGERLKLVVRFTDGAAPTSATFELVGHPARAARQVEVFRNRRTVEDYQQEVKEKEARIRQIQSELGRAQAEGTGLGIMGLIASGLLKVDVTNLQGVLAKNLKSTITDPPANALRTQTVISYRSTTTRVEKDEDVMRVAVAMVMENPGTALWTAKDAALLVGKGQDVKQVKVWQLAPIPPGGSGLVVVETELLAQEARGTFTLKLWDENGGRLVTLGGVTFP